MEISRISHASTDHGRGCDVVVRMLLPHDSTVGRTVGKK
jgi:hypothetical protein